jgi:hypothetical protein
MPLPEIAAGGWPLQESISIRLTACQSAPSSALHGRSSAPAATGSSATTNAPPIMNRRLWFRVHVVGFHMGRVFTVKFQEREISIWVLSRSPCARFRRYGAGIPASRRENAASPGCRERDPCPSDQSLRRGVPRTAERSCAD